MNDASLDPRGPVRLLASFAYYRKIDLSVLVEKLTQDGRPPSIIADSGAFSAHTMGWQVEPQDYADWLTKWEGMFDYEITLDVIGDPEASWRSHHNLQDVLGRAVIPVVHYGEPVETFDRYRDIGHSLIAIGGLAVKERAQKAKRYRWLIDIFRWAERTDTRFHGLGVGSFRQIYELPWWAVDSSSWGSAHRFGRSWVFDSDRGEMFQVSTPRVDPTGKYSAHNDRPARILRSMGVDPAHLCGDEFNRYWAGAVSADSYRRAEAWIRDRRGVIPGPPTDLGLNMREDSTGLRCYLVDGSPIIVGTSMRSLEGLRVYLAETEQHNATMLVGATDSPGRGGLDDDRRWDPTTSTHPSPKGTP